MDEPAQGRVAWDWLPGDLGMSDQDFQPLDDLDFGSDVRGFHPGQKLLNRYVLKRILGRGGMGVVWLAHDEALEREIAFKFLPEMVSHDRGALDDLKRETRRSLELTHPNIVRIYDFIHSEECAGISMEFIDGDTLSNLRAEKPNRIFEVEDLKPWMRQLGAALEYAHTEAKLAHRDLKPANLMLSKRGQLKVADFGISRSVSDTMTRVNFHQGASGTLVYMSPQQALGERPSIADDIYSLGATVYELLTSKPPFYQGEIMSQVREKEAASMAQRREELNIKGEPIPREWETTIAACLAKDPAKRPQSAHDVLVALGLAEPKTTKINVEVLPNPAKMPPASPAAGTPRVHEPGPRTEVVRKGKALVFAMVLLLVSGVAGWYAVTQSGIKKQAQAQAKAAADKAERDAALVAERKRRAEEAKKAELARVEQENARLAAAAKARADADAEATAKKAREEEEMRQQQAKLEQARLQNLRGSLLVVTEPPGATVTLNDGSPKITPAPFSGLPLATYRLSVSKPGYETANVTEVIREDPATGSGSSNRITVPLIRSTGMLTLDSIPQGATVTVSSADGVHETGPTPFVREKLPTGSYLVSVRYTGHDNQVWETNATIKMVAHATVKTNLALPFGRVTIDSQPKGAVVFQGETRIGETPLELAEIAPGPVEYQLRKKGFIGRNVSGTVRIQQTDRLTAALDAVKGPERGDRWTNSLGMKFVPIGDGSVLFCIWETRVRDFEVFAKSTPHNGTGWEKPGFKQEPGCPVINVSWNDADAFCKWLTQKERLESMLEKQSYRLPTDKEWSLAVGLPEEPGSLPADRDGKITGIYPWGEVWPPPARAGNYDGVVSYDAFDITAPVGSFRPNRLGIFDLGGNASEWCEDWYDEAHRSRVLRGGSWASSSADALNASYRSAFSPDERAIQNGFRCVLQIAP